MINLKGRDFLKLLDFTSRKGDVADPWYTGNFTETYRDVLEGTKALYEFIKNNEN